MRFERNESKMIERIMANKMYEKARHVLTEDIICLKILLIYTE